MASFKFSCSNCDQHIFADDSWSGREIQCPTCKARIIVPGEPEQPSPPPELRIHHSKPEPPSTASAPTKPRPGESHPRPRPAASHGVWCGLAIASFVTGLLFCACPAAVICGHLALRKFKLNPSLKGKWMAITGLILGYLGILVGVLSLVSVGAAFMQARKEFSPFQNSDAAIITETMEDWPAADEPSDLPPPPDSVSISTSPVSGTIDGQAVTCGYAEVKGTQLELKKSATEAANPWIVFFLHGPGNSLEQSAWVNPDNSRSLSSSIHVHYKKNDGANSFVLSRRDYTMRLEFGQISGGKLSGKVFLEAERPKPIKLEGSFEAVIK